MYNRIRFCQACIACATRALLAWSSKNNLTDVEGVVSAEAAAIGALYRDVGSYPEPARTTLQTAVRDYTVQVITVAWPAQAQGEVSDAGTRILTALQEELQSFEPSTAGQQAIHAEALRQFNEVVTLSRSSGASTSS